MTDDLFGKLPAQTELTVLSADDPERLKLGFVIHESNGCVVYLFQDGEMLQTPLINESDLQSGMEIAVCTLFGYVKATVVRKGTEVSAWTERFLYPLTWGEDERRCWVCTGGINRRCLTAEAQIDAPT